MKKNIRSIVPSLCIIGACAAVISGATYALFTSEAKTNIAISSGKVNVIAEIDDLEVYSPTSINLDGTINDATNAASNMTFANGGTVTINSNGSLTLSKLTAGDKVSFNIKMTNNSNVSTLYRTSFGYDENATNEEISDSKVLLSALSMNYNNSNDYEDVVHYVSKWESWGSEDSKTIPVTLELPSNASNALQNLSLTMYFNVEAVQGNAAVLGDDNVEEFEYMKTKCISASDLNTTSYKAHWNTLSDATTDTTSYILETGVYEDLDLALATGNVNGDEGGDLLLDGRGSTIKHVGMDVWYKQAKSGSLTIQNLTLESMLTRGRFENITIRNCTINGQLRMQDFGDANVLIENCVINNKTTVGPNEKKYSVYICAGTDYTLTVDKCAITNEKADGGQVSHLIGVQGGSVRTVNDALGIYLTNNNFTALAKKAVIKGWGDEKWCGSSFASVDDIPELAIKMANTFVSTESNNTFNGSDNYICEFYNAHMLNDSTHAFELE